MVKSKIQPLHRLNAFLERVFHFAHFGDEVRGVDKKLRSVATRENEVGEGGGGDGGAVLRR